MLIDSHAHLGHNRFSDDLPEVVARAAEAGVLQCVAPATDLANTQQLLDIHKRFPNVLPTAGIHPCDVDSVSPTSFAWVDELRELAARPAIAAIGEIGLDFYHPAPEGFTNDAWREHQLNCLHAQLDLAVELSLNTIIHTRESHDEMLAVIRSYTGRLRSVFHCFTGNADQARELIDLGHLVSFTGIVTFKNSPVIQATARDLPDGTFMFETDSPYLAPVPHRGQRCEPAYVAHTAGFVAALRDTSLEAVAAVTSATARNFFRGLGVA